MVSVQPRALMYNTIRQKSSKKHPFHRGEKQSYSFIVPLHSCRVTTGQKDPKADKCWVFLMSDQCSYKQVINNSSSSSSAEKCFLLQISHFPPRELQWVFLQKLRATAASFPSSPTEPLEQIKRLMDNRHW